MSLNNPNYESCQSWTDDLEICKNTGIGFSTNQIYREDGAPQEDHSYEDCSCHYMFADNFYWYAVFDGHEGKKTADFCSQRMAAEILFSQINEKTDEGIKDVLRQAFVSVEKEYMESIGALLAEKTSLQDDLRGYTMYEAYTKYPHIVEKIKSINNEISRGCAAAVALVINNILYVANVGNCRVLLCQTDSNSVMKVVQLSVDHDLRNEDELLRLSQIGVNTNLLKNSTHLGNQENTRCLGNYLVKGDYKEFEDLAMAMQEPVTAEADVHGGITLNESCKFLLLMSAGLYRSIEDSTGTDQVNKVIAQWVVDQFREQTTLTGVAQAVVDKTVRLHHDQFMSNNLKTNRRDDITLVLRNFNFPLRNDRAVSSANVCFKNPIIITSPTSSTQNTLTNTQASSFENNCNTNTSSSSSCQSRNQVDGGVGPDMKIDPYVDYGDYYKGFELAKRKGALPKWFLDMNS